MHEILIHYVCEDNSFLNLNYYAVAAAVLKNTRTEHRHYNLDYLLNNKSVLLPHHNVAILNIEHLCNICLSQILDRSLMIG